MISSVFQRAKLEALVNLLDKQPLKFRPMWSWVWCSKENPSNKERFDLQLYVYDSPYLLNFSEGKKKKKKLSTLQMMHLAWRKGHFPDSSQSKSFRSKTSPL